VIDLLHVPPHKVTAVLLAADARFVPASPQTIAQLSQAHNLPTGYILFVGTFEPRKNLHGLLRAYAALRADLPDAPRLVVAGRRGWLYAEVYALVDSLGLGPYITWAEDFPPAELPALYSGASVLCMPSFYEGFGLPALEAMACGTPVIVADRASLPEVVGGAGLLIDPDRPEMIAEAMGRVLSDSELAHTLRARGLQRAKRFSWRETAYQTLAIYQQTLLGAT